MIYFIDFSRDVSRFEFREIAVSLYISVAPLGQRERRHPGGVPGQARAGLHAAGPLLLLLQDVPAGGQEEGRRGGAGRRHVHRADHRGESRWAIGCLIHGQKP